MSAAPGPEKTRLHIGEAFLVHDHAAEGCKADRRARRRSIVLALAVGVAPACGGLTESVVDGGIDGSSGSGSNEDSGPGIRGGPGAGNGSGGSNSGSRGGSGSTGSSGSGGSSGSSSGAISISGSGSNSSSGGSSSGGSTSGGWAAGCDVPALFAAYCAIAGCHAAPGAPQGGLDLSLGNLSNLAGIMSNDYPGQRIVDPGNPMMSALYEELMPAALGPDGQMPPGGFLPASQAAADIECVAAWITTYLPPMR